MTSPVFIWILCPSMSCGNAKLMTHLEKIKPLLQSRLAFLQQTAHLTMAEKALDFATLLLGLNKGVDLMEGPEVLL
jgi:hypothetical protein